MSDRGFTHPNVGGQIRVEVYGREVRLTFVTTDSEVAEALADYIIEQLKAGAIHITVMGQVTDVVEEPR